MLEKPRIFSALDGYRGVAAIGVAIFHLKASFAGYLAVDFFLVLSGFVLAHNYLYRDREIEASDFIIRRLARLYPLHLISLVVFAFMALAVRGYLPDAKDGVLYTLLLNLLLVQNIGLNPSETTWNHPSWSISVEFWVNVLFIFFISRQTKSSVLFLLAVLGTIVIYNNTGHLEIIAANYYGVVNGGMVRGLSSFLLGILSYRIYLAYREDERILRHAGWMEVVLTLVALLIVFMRFDRNSPLDLLMPYLFLLIIAVSAFEAGPVSRLACRFTYFGKISYSVYLNHAALLILARNLMVVRGLSGWIVVPAYFIVLLLYSHLTYTYIEQPFRTETRRWLMRMMPLRAVESRAG